MKRLNEWKIAGGLAAVFLVLFFLPVGTPRFDRSISRSGTPASMSCYV